jgi:hypothetical protein
MVTDEARAVFDKISLEQLVENARLAAEIAANPPSGLVPPPSGLPLSDLPSPGLPENGVAPPENEHQGNDQK